MSCRNPLNASQCNIKPLLFFSLDFNQVTFRRWYYEVSTLNTTMLRIGFKHLYLPWNWVSALSVMVCLVEQDTWREKEHDQNLCWYLDIWYMKLYILCIDIFFVVFILISIILRNVMIDIEWFTNAKIQYDFCLTKIAVKVKKNWRRTVTEFKFIWEAKYFISKSRHKTVQQWQYIILKF